MHTLRSSQCYEHPEALREFDNLMRSAVTTIVNAHIDDKSWIQMTLPVGRGGLGIRRAEELALSAFIASASSALPVCLEMLPVDRLSGLDQAMEKWVKMYQCELPPENLRKHQKSWDWPVVERVYSQIRLQAKASGKPQVMAALLAASEKESAAWLHALPAACLGTVVNDEQVRVAVGLRFGLPVVAPHECAGCGFQVTPDGHHGLSCLYSKGRWSQHTELNSILERACIAAGFPCELEPKGVFRDNGKRPDGMTLVPVREGKQLVWDATFADTLAQSYLIRSAKAAGAAAHQAEIRKRYNYRGLGDQYWFYPFAVETLGVLGEAAREVVSFFGRKIKDRSGESRSTAFLKQRISLAIIKGNAAAVLGTLPVTTVIAKCCIV
ncbi:uncharacterized protein LOC129596553 [Paramacrobiotus metropolitanus]|uniref:uncharacterized protein LOC129596553 n=1 Tax=Paramacrobiotus metropolitanus TaxID=2943436 RepID=UPI0024460E36|nr:uncharacterized protein LOC129596553 [Paramacrobiotus metropolitanus]